MSSIENDSIQQLKSESTIQIEFRDSIVENLATTDDNNNINFSSSFQQYFSRKRCASIENLRKSNEEENNMNKKQRNPNEHVIFSNDTQNQQVRSLLDSNNLHYSQIDRQLGQELSYKTSISLENNCEHHLEWFKDFMRQSLDCIRDTVIEACLTAINNRSLALFNPNITTRDINVNNNVTRLVQSKHCLMLPKTIDNWQKNPPKILSVTQQENNLLLDDHILDDDDDDDDNNDETNKKQRIHQRARTSPYPMHKNVLRTFVSHNQVPWSYAWPQYQPVIFTADEIYINPGADPDLLNSSSSSILLHFNTIDGAVDRRSVYQQYRIHEDNGLPLNPIGRTGLQGRGVLLRWGPNKYHYIIVCRWKRDIYGNVLLHPANRKKILEILLEIQTSSYETHSYILTGGLHMIGSQFPPQLQDRLKRFIIHTGILLNQRKKTSTSLIALKNLFEQSPTPWKGAYFDDARNTDNAWIELSIEYILDYDHRLTSCIPSLDRKQLACLEQPRFVWKDVESRINIGPRTHYRLIKNLAHKLDAYF